LVPADAEWLTRAGDVAAIVKWNGVPRPFTRAAAEDLVARRALGWTDDTRATFAVTDRDASPGGYLSLRIGWSRGIGEVCYWLLPSHRGRGLMTDAVRVARDWAFDGLGLTRLQAGIQPGNAASEAVVVRLGFTPEGLLRSWDKLNGQLHDEHMYSLLPSDPRL
jgi:RimJ/RimL family protein N-acetyltransferase